MRSMEISFMKTKILIVTAALLAASPALAQKPGPQPDPVKFEVSRAVLAVIASGIMKLPYEQAQPLLSEMQRQLDAQTPKPEVKPAAQPEVAPNTVVGAPSAPAQPVPVPAPTPDAAPAK
jgi:hypothetical protein